MGNRHASSSSYEEKSKEASDAESVGQNSDGESDHSRLDADDQYEDRSDESNDEWTHIKSEKKTHLVQRHPLLQMKGNPDGQSSSEDEAQDEEYSYIQVLTDPDGDTSAPATVLRILTKQLEKVAYSEQTARKREAKDDELVQPSKFIKLEDPN